MSSIALSRFNFSGGENSAPIEDLTRLPQEDQQRLVLAGIDVHDTKVSGAFMQLNHADVHCTTRQEGLDLMDIRAALKKFDGLPQYYWKLLDPNKDEITRMAYEHLNGGYFVRARKGVKISQPVQSCMFIKGNAAGQAVHNIVVVEEGAELNILGGCATSQHSNDAAHLGITEYYVEKGGKLTFSMMYFPNEYYLLPLSHDENVHGKATIMQKMFGEYEQKFPQARLLYLYMYAHPGKKLLFMGSELGQLREWTEEQQQDWDILKYPIHDAFYHYMLELNRL